VQRRAQFVRGDRQELVLRAVQGLRFGHPLLQGGLAAPQRVLDLDTRRATSSCSSVIFWLSNRNGLASSRGQKRTNSTAGSPSVAGTTTAPRALKSDRTGGAARA
jgi:hypothetical protein